VVAADFDGDATPDIATIDPRPSRSSPRRDCNGMSVFVGKGDGAFRRPVNSCVRSDGSLVDGSAIADVNGDARPDIVILRTGRNESIVIWVNDGGGRFHVDRVDRLEGSAFGLVAADLNADGIADLVTQNGVRRELVVLLGTGGGRFGPARRYTGDVAAKGAGFPFGAVAVGDVNGDGKPDAVLISDRGVGVVRLGDGDGGFGPERTFGDGLTGESVTLGDLNHDAALDVVAPLRESNVAVLLGHGDGTFSAGRRYSIDPPELLWEAALADFDSDGNIDMAVMSFAAKDALFVRPGRGDGTFGARQAYPTPEGTGGSVVADFNRDGRPDLAYDATPRHSRGGVAVSLNWSGQPAPPCVPGFLFRTPLRAAKRQLKRAGCRPGRIRHRSSRKVRRNGVISQRPRSGAILANHARVDLVVSRGRRR